jgi:hypothetical protein
VGSGLPACIVQRGTLGRRITARSQVTSSPTLHHRPLKAFHPPAYSTDMKLSVYSVSLSLVLIATFAIHTLGRPHEEIELLVPRALGGCGPHDLEVKVGPLKPGACDDHVCIDSPDALLKNVFWRGCGPALCTEEGPKGNNALEKRTGGSFSSLTGYRGR